MGSSHRRIIRRGDISSSRRMGDITSRAVVVGVGIPGRDSMGGRDITRGSTTSRGGMEGIRGVGGIGEALRREDEGL